MLRASGYVGLAMLEGWGLSHLLHLTMRSSGAGSKALVTEALDQWPRIMLPYTGKSATTLWHRVVSRRYRDLLTDSMADLHCTADQVNL